MMISLMSEKSTTKHAPILLRAYKQESELEVWKQDKTGRFALLTTYPICRWSGDLGPKVREGDRQAPEGFYTVAKHQLNPASRHHRSFNLGYPNLYDRAHGRTGDYLMVHGGCSSAGCFAVTDEAVDEIWRLVTAAIGKGQDRFQVQSFPFRMTKVNLDLYKGHRWYDFWMDLKPGYDAFEASGVPPVVKVCNGRYAFAPGKPGAAPANPPGSVDARFTLAAERTVLAWVRTALGFIAGGVAIVYVAPSESSEWLDATIGVLMVVVGAAIAVTGGYRWRRTMTVLRDGGDMPGPSAVLLVVAAIVVVSVFVATAILVTQT